MLLSLTLLGVALLAAVFGARWLYRRWDNVDSYYEREQRDPPVTDVGGYAGGDR